MTYKTLEEPYKAKLHINMKLMVTYQWHFVYESNKNLTLWLQIIEVKN